MKEIIDEQMVMDEKEQLVITRIQKFSKIAKTMGLEVHLGFSGGKDRFKKPKLIHLSINQKSVMLEYTD